MAAATFDAVQRLSYYTLAIAGAKPSEPAPFPRPGAQVEAPKSISLSEFNTLLQQG